MFYMANWVACLSDWTSTTAAFGLKFEFLVKTTRERNSYTYRKGSLVKDIMQLKIQTCANMLEMKIKALIMFIPMINVKSPTSE